MFYLNYVTRPSYALLKSNPKEYWEQWKDYTKARLNAQLRQADFESDMHYLSLMRMQNMASGVNFGSICPGCTLGGGFGIFM